MPTLASCCFFYPEGYTAVFEIRVTNENLREAPKRVLDKWLDDRTLIEPKQSGMETQRTISWLIPTILRILTGQRRHYPLATSMSNLSAGHSTEIDRVIAQLRDMKNLAIQYSAEPALSP
ncbi:conserved hypothetical protein [Histoplasma capsulatum var. duboisii H88]|uniref:Uncharacterized protein n=1 Tax=Ajellomyces capsulatus (strain H88) TaxID=544711 RepID=F0U764_AJEC8|nr:conserved hypothetical protein [Histoplasma capsulatum var. duboisii H88]